MEASLSSSEQNMEEGGYPGFDAGAAPSENRFDLKISAADTASPTKVDNWRQLFGEEELNRAYQRSIIVINSQAREEDALRINETQLLNS